MQEVVHSMNMRLIITIKDPVVAIFYCLMIANVVDGSEHTESDSFVEDERPLHRLRDETR